MPKHYAINANVVKGSVHFQHSKYAIAYFKDENGKQISFSKRPFVSLTVSDDTNKPATRIGWKKSGNLYVGCRIKFASRFTGDVDWEVKE